MLELTFTKIVQIVCAFALVYSLGLQRDVSQRTKELAGIVWHVCVVIILVIAFTGH